MAKNTRGRVSKDDWLAQALEILAAEGEGGIRIERLARDLNIAKSGFYWHFKDRRDLLSNVLDYWAYEYTGVVAQNKQLARANPESRLNQATRMIRVHKLTKYDVSMRAWAEHDEMAAEAVAQVYQMRLGYIREAFSELGFRGDELEMRARLYVCYHSWEAAMFGNDSERKLGRLQKLRLKLLTRK
jgi:AcrR family transcriptional regulator